ncbi:MAG: cytochrome c4 [Gammaproteobacteria bacterium]|nr:cytochrome c4 [Gammaproteobacteria bacterium]MBL6999960.1 cytochrome c4 [Gammaproteobacteria bacterium]
MLKILFAALSLFIAQTVSANEQQLIDALTKAQQDTESSAEAIQQGSSRAFICKYCHGEDGNSKKSTIPNLAGQNPVYLLRQIEMFSNGQRNNKTMNEIARVLTLQDKVNIALFYSSQQVTEQTPYRPELVAEGKQLFETRCFFCHGRDAHGKEELPRIASQPADYVVNTLSSYSSSLVKRVETPMSRVARTLEKDEIQALAAYLTSLE